jgi:hypothetical protein
MHPPFHRDEEAVRDARGDRFVPDMSLQSPEVAAFDLSFRGLLICDSSVS